MQLEKSEAREIVKDPVCGMTVDPATALSAVQDGATFYFCHESCRRKFLGLAPLHPAKAPAKAFYCPMCPGEESDVPGLCARCGMALEGSGISAGVAESAELQDMARRLMLGLWLGLPVFLLAMGPMLWLPLQAWLPEAPSRWIQACLATPVVAWCGAPFFQRAWLSLRQGGFNMFTLIALGVGTAYLTSVVTLLWPGLVPESFRHHGQAPVYFEAAAMIVVLVLVGQVLELKARHRTGGAIRELLALAPVTAVKVSAEGDVEAPLEEVHPGDVLRVRPGARVPVDGVVVEGRGSLDTSALTGESLPVEVDAGDEVAAGTINQSGAFLMTARRVGAETLFARMVQLVSEAQRSRAPVQRLVDRVSAVFVPAVVGAALLAGAGWAWLGPEPRLAHALLSAVSVLIVACPCALGLATPMAIMVGVGRGARLGVLIRDAAVLETLRQVNTLVVDKTGTLTEGRFAVVSVTTAPGFSENEVLAWAAALEVHSEHPLARAVVRFARGRGLDLPPVSDFASTAGEGVSGVVAGHPVGVGRAQSRPANTLRDEGLTPVGVVVDGRPAATLWLADRVRAGTPQAVRDLRALGIRVMMVTGDRQAAAERVAREVGIGDVHAGVLPADKCRRVQALKAEGRCVAVAGDGINDAAALAAADVGIAMGTGTDVAMETAGMVLVQGDLRGIVRGIRLSRAVMRNIRQNLFWAFGYNVAAVPLAAGALSPWLGWGVNPMIAAAAMSLSSVTVIANALRLRAAVPIRSA